MRDFPKHGSASSGGWLSPLILPLAIFGNENQRREPQVEMMRKKPESKENR